MMVLTLDNLATRYHVLPTEAMERATTLDLYVLDVATKWQTYQQQRANGKSAGVDKQTKVSQQHLKAMMEVARRVTDERNI